MLNTNVTKPTEVNPTARIDATKIKLGVPVVCSAGVQFGIVDRVEGTTSIKLNKDDKGVHHYIPMSWIARVEDDKVYANRPGAQIKREWMTEPPKA